MPLTSTRYIPSSRKAQADMLEWFPRIMLMAVATIIIVMLVRVYTNRDADAPELHRATYLYRLYYDDIIMYADAKTGRVYPGIVDMTKFNDAQLDKVFVARDTYPAQISSKLMITPVADCAIASQTAYNNKKTFEQYVGNTAQMKGAATQETVTYPVTIRENARTCAAQLNIIVVRPNS